MSPPSPPPSSCSGGAAGSGVNNNVCFRNVLIVFRWKVLQQRVCLRPYKCHYVRENIVVRLCRGVARVVYAHGNDTIVWSVRPRTVARRQCRARIYHLSRVRDTPPSPDTQSSSAAAPKQYPDLGVLFLRTRSVREGGRVLCGLVGAFKTFLPF